MKEAKIEERREPEKAAQAIINLVIPQGVNTICLCNRCYFMVNVLYWGGGRGEMRDRDRRS